ncbi:MAG: hypothetical protein ACE37H_04735 [Phycisphaeraceae bacterium]
MGFGRSNRHARPADARRRAIAETSAFLSWALASDQPMPRIPRRRVDRGGFAQMLKSPLAGKLVMHWWASALDRIRNP